MVTGRPTSGTVVVGLLVALLAVPVAGLGRGKGVALATAATVEKPSGIRQLFGDEPQTSRVVSWYTSGPAESLVQYGKSEALGSEVTGYTVDAAGTAVHHCVLTGLEADTTYFFRAGGPDSGWSEVRNFTTAPARKTGELHFVAFGDSRSNRPARRVIARAVVANQHAFFPSDVEFVLTTGDLVSDGGKQSLWNAYFDDYDAIYREVPVMPVQGNHEIGSTGSLYTQNFRLPQNGNDGWYYSFSHSMAHFVACDSESHGFPPYDLFDLNWLRWDLGKAEQDPAVLWRFAFFHQPPFVSSSHQPREDIREDWWPIFEEGGLDIAYAGHCHHYERSYPVDANGVPNKTGSPNFVDPAEPIMVVTGAAGMGGLPSATPSRANDYMAAFNGSYHYCDVYVSNDQATGKTTLSQKTVAVLPALFENGTIDESRDPGVAVIDAFTITKDIPDSWYESSPDIVYVGYSGASTNLALQVVANVLTAAGLVALCAFVVWRRGKVLRENRA
ncbi:MAG: purple acid phosphatase family protein [Promethearchaeota archaeon]